MSVQVLCNVLSFCLNERLDCRQVDASYIFVYLHFILFWLLSRFSSENCMLSHTVCVCAFAWFLQLAVITLSVYMIHRLILQIEACHFLWGTSWIFTCNVDLILILSAERARGRSVVSFFGSFGFCTQMVHVDVKRLCVFDHWSRFSFEKLVVIELLIKFTEFYGTRRFVTVCAKAYHLYLSRVSWIQFIV
jgi:hypothetical protein